MVQDQRSSYWSRWDLSEAFAFKIFLGKVADRCLVFTSKNEQGSHCRMYAILETMQRFLPFFLLDLGSWNTCINWWRKKSEWVLLLSLSKYRKNIFQHEHKLFFQKNAVMSTQKGWELFGQCFFPFCESVPSIYWWFWGLWKGLEFTQSLLRLLFQRRMQMAVLLKKPPEMICAGKVNDLKHAKQTKCTHEWVWHCASWTPPLQCLFVIPRIPEFPGKGAWRHLVLWSIASLLLFCVRVFFFAHTVVCLNLVFLSAVCLRT